MWHRHPAWLYRVFELLVAARLMDFVPAVFGQSLDHIPAVHGLRPISFLLYTLTTHYFNDQRIGEKAAHIDAMA